MRCFCFLDELSHGQFLGPAAGVASLFAIHVLRRGLFEFPMGRTDYGDFGICFLVLNFGIVEFFCRVMPLAFSSKFAAFIREFVMVEPTGACTPRNFFCPYILFVKDSLKDV